MAKQGQIIAFQSKNRQAKIEVSIRAFNSHVGGISESRPLTLYGALSRRSKTACKT